MLTSQSRAFARTNEGISEMDGVLQVRGDGNSARGGMEVALGIATQGYGTPRPQRGQRGTSMTTTAPVAPTASAAASTPAISAAPDLPALPTRIATWQSAVSRTLAGWRYTGGKRD